VHVFTFAWCAFVCIPLTASYAYMYMPLYIHAGSAHGAGADPRDYNAHRVDLRGQVRQYPPSGACVCGRHRVLCMCTRVSHQLCVHVREFGVYVHQYSPAGVCELEREVCVCL